ncbi:MAG: carboxypeptidase-like regulatory domain-containing protein, partial [Candidatus Cloacimonetes bacterium]|nr:carboxypeptidase-like regulatory domain-containing protein [Candidatus Cloacimonadota bacterium]
MNDTNNATFDTDDYSGIQISLYGLAEVDSVQMRIANQYSHIGVSLDQNIIFKHEGHNPIYETTTSEDGTFVFKDLNQGRYNLVIEKDDWGTVYRYNVDVSEGDNSITKYETSTINMFPANRLGESIDNSFTFKEDHEYFIEGNAVFWSEVQFEGNSYVRMSPNASISLMSSVLCPDNAKYTVFCSLNESNQEVTRWNSIKIYESNVTLSNFVLRYGNNGLEFMTDNCRVENSIFEDLTTAIYSPGKNTGVVNCTFYKITDRCLNINQAQESDEYMYLLHNNVFYKVFIGVRTQGRRVSIKHNYFVECNNSIISFTGDHTIENNSFDRNTVGILCNGTQIEIEHNNFFENDTSILFSRAYYSTPSNPNINENNFFQLSGYAIKLDAWTTSGNVDAENNYWNSQNIDALIYDKHDL